jgi:hypothetical protein
MYLDTYEIVPSSITTQPMYGTSRVDGDRPGGNATFPTGHIQRRAATTPQGQHYDTADSAAPDL